MRYILAVAVLALSACSDTTGLSFEETQHGVTLSPFGFVSVDVSPSQQSYVTSLVLYARPGIAPVVDIRVSNPSIVSIWPTQAVMEPDPLCGNPCTRVRWRYDVIFVPERLGESVVTATLRGNPSQQSAFLVRVVP
jgi:hypothetical protein